MSPRGDPAAASRSTTRSTPRWEISAELDSSRKLSEVRAVRLDGDEVHERSFSLAEPGQEVLLGSFVAHSEKPLHDHPPGDISKDALDAIKRELCPM